MNLPSKTKVLVAMSGGVDSSVAASLLKEQGHDLIGVTMRVVPEMHTESVFEPCCSVDTAEDARAVADRMGFPHHVINYIDDFENHVIMNFIDEYTAGRTPNPCIRCNILLKFGILLEKAKEYGADYIATGHYVRIEKRGERYGILRAVHRPKDQSYVLAGLSQDQLKHVLFPLGELSKEETRQHARELGLETAEKAESQEICFIPDNNYRGFIEQRLGKPEPGPILNTSAEILGEHTGLIHYTVGQRKGLGLTAPRPLYVLRLDVAQNALIVGHEEETYSDGLIAEDIVWSAIPPQTEPFECNVQIRYLHKPVNAIAHPVKDGLDIRFDEPQKSVTPGQWAVCYDMKDYVLAAGIICS